MTQQTDDPEDNASAQETPEAVSDSNRRRPFVLSIVGLAVAAIALGLASIPAIVFERPLPNPFAQEKEEKPRVEPPREREGGITLKYKSLSVNVGGKAPKKEEVAKAAPRAEVTKDPVHWFTIAAIGCALIGLVLSSFAQVRERHTVLTISAMGCCVAAITWQYVAIGIAVGAAVAAFLVMLAILGAMFQ
ncbi:MAG: hypothetical protein ABFD16_13690 [Thermoguttaceae bacterium]